MKTINKQTVVKQTKRNKRVWIEGSALREAGFTWHTMYSRTIKNGVITMIIDPAGTLKTAGRMRNGKEIPIIDISIADLEGFTAGQNVTATFTDGKIVIK